jgi:ribose 5-phosphate isomerase A
VPTSHVTETIARAHRLNVLDFAMVESVDYLFDGADEVDEQFQMLKGMQGAIARQRLVATVAKRRLYLIQEGKLTSRLGTKSTLPVVIMHFALSVIRAELRNLGLSGVLRRTMNGDLFLTDHGHLILDLMIGDREPMELADALDHVPGVVDHGLFLDECDELLIENSSGELRRLVRPDDE